MTIQITVPALGESVTEATVGQWFKKPGDAVAADEPLVELETDKVTLEVPAPAAGVLADIQVPQGTTVAVGSVLGSISEGASAPKAPATATTKPAPEIAPTRPAPPPQAAPPAASRVAPAQARPAATQSGMPPSPAARKAMEENGLSAEDVPGSGRRGQILK